MRRQRVCEICGKKRDTFICAECVARDVNKINEQLSQKDTEIKELKDKFEIIKKYPLAQGDIQHALEFEAQRNKFKEDIKQKVLDEINKRIKANEENIKLFPKEKRKYEEFVQRLNELLSKMQSIFGGEEE